MKTFFNDDEDGASEPIPGIPEALHADERIVWQGKPKALRLAVQTLHVRLIFVCFALFTVWRLSTIVSRGGADQEALYVALIASLAGVFGAGILIGLGVAMAQSTIYTITDKRIILRHGVTIRKYVNIPFEAVQTARLKVGRTHTGSIALATSDTTRVPYLHLWPHVRPWKLLRPETMMRAIPDVEHVADILCTAIKSHAPSAITLALEKPAPQTLYSPANNHIGESVATV